MKIETEWPILPAINAKRHVDKNFTYFFLNAVDHYRWIFLRKPAEESWNSHPFVLKTGDSRQLRRDKLKIILAKTWRFVFQYGGSYTFIWYPLTSYFAILYLLPSLPSRPLKEEDALFASIGLITLVWMSYNFFSWCRYGWKIQRETWRNSSLIPTKKVVN